MKSDKIEIDFKNKLNEREIKPTQQAWDRLDAMLTIAEEKKAKRKFPWFFIAASIILFLFAGISFFTQNDKTIEAKNNEVVIESESIPTQEKVKSIILLTSNPETVAVIHDVKKTKSAKDKKQFATPTENTNITNQNPIAENPIINQKNEQESIIPQKQEVAIVEKQINIQKPSNKSKVKIDAGSLLSQVDGELDLTFREKVLQTVGKNYKTVKVALANRNQQ